MNRLFAALLMIAIVGCKSEPSVEKKTARGGDSDAGTISQQVETRNGDSVSGGTTSTTGTSDPTAGSSTGTAAAPAFVLVGFLNEAEQPRCSVEHSIPTRQLRVTVDTHPLNKFQKVIGFKCTADLLAGDSTLNFKEFPLNAEMIDDTVYSRTFTMANNVVAIQSPSFVYKVGALGTMRMMKRRVVVTPEYRVQISRMNLPTLVKHLQPVHIVNDCTAVKPNTAPHLVPPQRVMPHPSIQPRSALPRVQQ